MTKYQKYTWVCTGDCDALIEYTCKDGYGWPNGVIDLTCPCNSKCTLLSVEDATIPYTDTPLTKEETMETETPAVIVPDTYNANLLVTYKVIHGYSDATYDTDKVAGNEEAYKDLPGCCQYDHSMEMSLTGELNDDTDSDEEVNFNKRKNRKCKA